MLNLPFIVAVSFIYIALLFVVALWGDRHPVASRFHPWVYAMSLTVFCTSWTFYGATQQFAENGWFFSPTHIGTILLFVFGMAFWRKLIRVAKKENVTTISDFISSRFGYSRAVSILAAAICLIGVVPYIALQLKAVSISFNLVAGVQASADAWYFDSAFYISIAMAGFAALFGTRHLDTSEHHPGMMLAIAFEALIKLFVFLLVGYWAVTVVGGGVFEVFKSTLTLPSAAPMISGFNNTYIYMTQVFLGVLGIFALPRQFHVAVVEYKSNADLRTARWLFPLYLVAINLFIAPLAIVGLKHFSGDTADLEYLILKLPLSLGREDLAVMAFIGGLSAATSMVIVATVALSTMLSNEILLPLLVKTGIWHAKSMEIGRRVLRLRRAGIMLIVLTAFLYYRWVVEFEGLIAIGLLSFVAVAQFTPALVIGLFWTGVNRTGAIWGLSLGFFMWAYTLLLPLVLQAGLGPQWLYEWLFNQSLLNPHALFGLSGIDSIAHGLAWSLALNVLGLILGSAYGRESLKDRLQATRFVHSRHDEISEWTRRISIGDLHALVGKFIYQDKLSNLFNEYVNPLNGRLLLDEVANDELLHKAERTLASILGAPAARLLFDQIEQQRGGHWRDVNSIVDEASQVLKFNRDLLNSALQSINQGISIVDQDLNVVAWNKTFQTLFAYPDEELAVGRPLEALIRYNFAKGEFGQADVDSVISERLSHLLARTSYAYQRKRANGTYLEIEGRPMADGGYITVYTDITSRIDIESKLRRHNEELEGKVLARTSALQTSNAQLEKANQNKTRFLAAAGHDLVQPLNSAALFSASLTAKLRRQHNTELSQLSEQVEDSLTAAESLLNELLEVSKLDSGIIKPALSTFALAELMASLASEFSVVAKQRKIDIQWVKSSIFVTSDARLLRRILHNFVSNALKYVGSGRVLVGVRRQGAFINIEVWDTGPGLTDNQCQSVFDEFYRVPEYASKEQGLGLGLSIVKRMADLLEHEVQVRSVLGRGSCFSIKAPLGHNVELAETIKEEAKDAPLNAHILCLDNEQAIVEGMKSLITEWGYSVSGAYHEVQATQALQTRAPDLVIVDYHLDDGQTGLAVVGKWQASGQCQVPVIVITADYTDQVRAQTERLGFRLLKKPVRPRQLKNLIEQSLK